MGELLRPPSHRGPLIAAGAVVLTVGVALMQVRLAEDLGNGFHLVVAAALAALLLWLGLQGPREGRRPAGHQSALLVCGLLASWVALLRLADVLGADFDGDDFPAGAFVWTSLVQAGLALLAATRGDSGIAAFIAAVAVAVAVVSAADWIGDPSVGAIRLLLLLIAMAYALVSLVLRASRPRHAEVLVSAAGAATLAIAASGAAGVFAFFFGFGLGGGELLPGFWEIVVLAAGLGLVAYAAADHVPGPAWVGFANLIAFVAATTILSDDTLRWWPALLLITGGAMLAAGLRPRRPLPPEPSGYASDDVPLYVKVRE